MQLGRIGIADVFKFYILFYYLHINIVANVVQILRAIKLCIY